jgi:hypothetical protein
MGWLYMCREKSGEELVGYAHSFLLPFLGHFSSFLLCSLVMKVLPSLYHFYFCFFTSTVSNFIQVMTMLLIN